MHKAFVTQFDIGARNPDVLRRFYALLFGWRLSPDGTAARNGVGGVISSAADDTSGGVKLVVEVDDVLENVCYVEELWSHHRATT